MAFTTVPCAAAVACDHYVFVVMCPHSQAVRIKQQQEIAARERETIYKMAAHAFAHRFLDDLVPSVYKVLSDGGYFHDPVERG